MLPPPRRGSDSMEIVCKLRHIRGVMPSWGGFPPPHRKCPSKPSEILHLLARGTANLGVGDLGCAPVGMRDCISHLTSSSKAWFALLSLAKAQLPFCRPCFFLPNDLSEQPGYRTENNDRSRRRS
ncbi:hypothetical protein PspLS_08541 [Pyricularia sp. CBS 133598]|nr:hypothetical protein PspLS_08541 [Pyricularia sp. CBS 133598]